MPASTDFRAALDCGVSGLATCPGHPQLAAESVKRHDAVALLGDAEVPSPEVDLVKPY
jgi:hypothetical protein